MSDWLIEIIHNLAMLLSLGLLFHLLRQLFHRDRRTGNLLFGLLCGGLGVFCIATAFVYRPGVVFDSRTIVMVLAGLFGGGSGGVIAMAVTGVYRWSIAGPGVWAGLASIAAAGTTGILARRLISRSSWPPSPGQLWISGMAGHLLVLACMLLLPEPMRRHVLVNSAVPFLAIYPLAVVALGTVMAREESRSSTLSRLRQAEWLFSEAQKLTRFGSWEYHLETDRLVATPHFHELLGLPMETAPLSLQDFFGRLHADDWDVVRLAFDAAIAGRSGIDVQGRLLADDGQLLWIRVVGKPIVVKGKTVQLVGNLVDITRRKTSELALRASEERLQAIIDHAPALICLCDLEGRITLTNQRFAVFGPPAATVIGRPIYEQFPRGGAIEQWIDDLVALQAGESVEYEEDLRHADGTMHTYLTRKFLLAAPGERPATACCIAADITELRRALAGLQQLTAELTVKNDELERFGYSVSHDLKAPLLTIGSYAALLREDFHAVDRDQAMADLDHIDDAVISMRRLIDDLLGLSRNGRTLGELAAVDLNLVTAEALQLLAGEIRQAGATITIAPDLPTVMGDASRLRQVLQNLLQNAIKYRRPDQPVRIDINWGARLDGAVWIAVKDDGRGIATADQQRVFELFERVGDGTEGVGVGLALAQRIMRKLGGDIMVESAGQGAGSVFILEFPPPPPWKSFAARIGN